MCPKMSRFRIQGRNFGLKSGGVKFPSLALSIYNVRSTILEYACKQYVSFKQN